MSTIPVTPDIEPDQRTAAKVAGYAYLITTFLSVFAEFYARSSLIVLGDPAQTARNIVSSERLFRIGAVGNLLPFGVVLVVSLYVILKPINRHLALLAAFWRLGECVIVAVISLIDFAVLSLLRGGSGYLGGFNPEQLQGLAYTLLRLHGAGYLIAMVFYGLGSTMFALLWFKSRYIPRSLAALGIFSAAVAGIVIVATMIFPTLARVITVVYYGPPGLIFEVGLGLWLIIKGIQAPTLDPATG
jgi:Domain of unknown function (DUF4386)